MLAKGILIYFQFSVHFEIPNFKLEGNCVIVNREKEIEKKEKIPINDILNEYVFSFPLIGLVYHQHKACMA